VNERSINRQFSLQYSDSDPLELISLGLGLELELEELDYIIVIRQQRSLETPTLTTSLHRDRAVLSVSNRERIAERPPGALLIRRALGGRASGGNHYRSVRSACEPATWVFRLSVSTMHVPCLVGWPPLY